MALKKNIILIPINYNFKKKVLITRFHKMDKLIAIKIFIKEFMQEEDFL